PSGDRSQGAAALCSPLLMPTTECSSEDNHNYYVSRVYGPGERRSQDLWVDIAVANRSHVKVHRILSSSHRQASRVVLSFDFPFYGHPLRQITIATGGFIFMGDVLHRMLTATQYVAPLMANFNPGYSDNSTVAYFDNGTVFVVQWDHVYLQGREDRGSFTFQAVLHQDGRIVFGYKEIPMAVLEISSTQHPVKAGLSDAFMILNSSPEVPESRRRTIFEYHRVELDSSKITNTSAVEFTPLPTCLQHQSCDTCTSSNLTFNCSWCHVLQRCSSGFDRYRQEWLAYGCAQEAEGKTCEDFQDEGYYSASPDSSFGPFDGHRTTSSPLFIDSLTTEDDTKLNPYAGGDGLQDNLSPKTKGPPVHLGTIVGIVLAVFLVATIILAGIYVSGHPNSNAALFFIELHNPTIMQMFFLLLPPPSPSASATGPQKESTLDEQAMIVAAAADNDDNDDDDNDNDDDGNDYYDNDDDDDDNNEDDNDDDALKLTDFMYMGAKEVVGPGSSQQQDKGALVMEALPTHRGHRPGSARFLVLEQKTESQSSAPKYMTHRQCAFQRTAPHCDKQVVDPRVPPMSASAGTKPAIAPHPLSMPPLHPHQKERELGMVTLDCNFRNGEISSKGTFPGLCKSSQQGISPEVAVQLGCTSDNLDCDTISAGPLAELRLELQPIALH
ncbi:hypothetical protein STEG23_014678, partial [Scotinomys teguina]